MPINLNQRLARGRARNEVAWVFDKADLPVVGAQAAAYGLAVVMDKDFNVVYRPQQGDPPRPVADDQFTLIATNETLRISFNSGVPNTDNKRAIGVPLDRVTEADGATSKERAVRLRATLEFGIDRHSSKAATEIYNRMAEHGRDAKRLTKKELLKSFGQDLAVHMQNFLQTAVNDVGVAGLNATTVQSRGEKSLTPVLSDMGLNFKGVVLNLDKRSVWKRLIWPSPSYDHRWVTALKLITPVITTSASILVALYIAGIIPPATIGTLSINAANGYEYADFECTVVKTGQSHAGVCKAAVGEQIMVAAHPPSLTQVDPNQTSIEVFESWNCPAGSPWCAGVDRTQAAITLTVPDDPGEFTITPTYRTDKLIKLRIETSEPRIANIPAATVRRQDCSGAECAHTRNGADNLYIFQVRDNAPPPTVTITPPADSSFNFSELQCDGGQCPTNGADGLTLTLDNDVTARAVYSEQVMLTIVNNNQGVDFGESTLPSHCERVRATISCAFDYDELVTLTIAPDLSDDTRRFLHWQCEGGTCGALSEINRLDRLFILSNERLGGNMAVTPIFEDIVFTALTLEGAMGGSVSADCERTGDCRRAEGWRAEVTATPDDGYRFVSWDCVGNSCPASRTANPIRLTLDSSVTLTPIFEAITTVSLTIGLAPNGSAEADCGSDCDRAPGWRTEVTATPDSGYRFVGWDCIGDSCPSARTANPIRLNINDNVTLTPIFEDAPTASLTVGIASNGSAATSCGSDCDRDPGWSATVVAMPDDGYEFAGWDCTGSCPSGAENSVADLIIREDTRITPIFRLSSTSDNSGSNERTDSTPDDDYGDSRSGATRINLGSRTNGNIESAGDEDYFRVTVSRRGTLTIFTDGNTDTYGTLLSASGSTLVTNDDSGNGTNFRIVREVSSGTYYIAVRHFRSSGTGAYRLSVQFANSATFFVTDDTYPETVNLDNIVRQEFGSGACIADYNDILAFHNSGGDLLQLWRDLDLEFSTPHNEKGVHVTLNDSHNNGRRYYYALIFVGRVPGYHLAHRQIGLGTHTLSIGSWFGLDNPIIAKSCS